MQEFLNMRERKIIKAANCTQGKHMCEQSAPEQCNTGLGAADCSSASKDRSV